jgi:glycosyltransferase involved in cell wall biosynthesis
MNGRSHPAGIAVVLSGFPRRSETFALNELLALEAHGLLAAVFATKAGDGLPPHPDYRRLRTPVQRLAGESAAEQARHLICCLNGRPVAAIHAYFAHLPAEVAGQAAAELNLPYGFSIHARDARKVAPAVLAERAQQAACVVACNQDVAADLEARGAAVQLLPHGVDTDRFQPHPFPPADPLHLLAVGRFVEKKGFALLIEAMAQLPIPWRLRLVGDGPERERLVAAVQAAGLGYRVEFSGSLTHEELPAAYAAAHLVIVPSIVDSSGDRDGLPNVVLEAMASGRPVIASEVAAIDSAVTDGRTGLLVPPGDADALAAAITRLAAEPDRWLEYGRQGQQRVATDFALTTCTDRFCHFLQQAYQVTTDREDLPGFRKPARSGPD